MYTKKLIAAVAVFAATSSAFANEWADFSNFKSTKTRAEVAAELKESKENGQLAGNTEFVEFKNTPVAFGKTGDKVGQKAAAATKAKSNAAGG